MDRSAAEERPETRAIGRDALSRERPLGDQLIHEENVSAVLEAVNRLPSRQRQVMHLTTVEELTQAEVAEVLGISIEAVKASLSVARKTLREQLNNLYQEVCGNKICGKGHEREKTR